MNRFQKSFIIGVLLWMWLAVSMAEEVSREQIKGPRRAGAGYQEGCTGYFCRVDQLEEKLIYPSNTQVSLFVTLVKGDKFRLDAVKIKIDARTPCITFTLSKSWKPCRVAAYSAFIPAISDPANTLGGVANR